MDELLFPDFVLTWTVVVAATVVPAAVTLLILEVAIRRDPLAWSLGFSASYLLVWALAAAPALLLAVVASHFADIVAARAAVLVLLVLWTVHELHPGRRQHLRRLVEQHDDSLDELDGGARRGLNTGARRAATALQTCGPRTMCLTAAGLIHPLTLFSLATITITEHVFGNPKLARLAAVVSTTAAAAVLLLPAAPTASWLA